MPPVSPPPRFARLTGCVDRWWRDRVLLVMPDGTSLELAGAAGLLWMALEVPGSAAELQDRVSLVLAGAQPPPLPEVEAALAMMSEAGLVVPADD
jgi:hypothetical protein